MFQNLKQLLPIATLAVALALTWWSSPAAGQWGKPAIAAAAKTVPHITLAAAFDFAAADLERLSDHEKFFAAYFWLGDVPTKERTQFIRAFARYNPNQFSPVRDAVRG